MRLVKLLVGIALWAGVTASASAAPVSTPFLKLDLNGDSGGGAGPTQTDLGYTGFNLANTPAGPTLSTTVGSNTVTLTFAANATGYLSRNRGAFTPATASPLYQDFLGAARNASFGLGSNSIQIQVSGLTPSSRVSHSIHSRRRAASA